MDTELVMLCLTIFAMLAGISFFIFSNYFHGRSKFFRKKKGPSKSAHKDRGSADRKDEWLKGTYAPGYQKTKSTVRYDFSALQFVDCYEPWSRLWVEELKIDFCCAAKPRRGGQWIQLMKC